MFESERKELVFKNKKTTRKKQTNKQKQPLIQSFWTRQIFSPLQSSHIAFFNLLSVGTVYSEIPKSYTWESDGKVGTEKSKSQVLVLLSVVEL